MDDIRFDEVRAWLFDAALPFWATHGIDDVAGGFVEQLDLDARDAGMAFKRTRVQARQIYCFTHAALLGWAGGAAVAARGWDFLIRHGRRADGGWVRRMGREGGVVDGTPDAYDIAFVLFAHAWRYRLTGDEALVTSALTTLDALDAALAQPDGLGWASAGDAPPGCEQNPHMHLLEAAIELADAMPEPRFRAMAERLIGLFRDRLFDPATATLHEHYAPGWQARGDAAGRIVEPGHLLEWSWMLHRADRLLGTGHGREARLLRERTLAIGVVGASGLAIDRIDRHGAVLDGGSRLWPQTELLKALLAGLEREGNDHRRAIARTVANLLDLYLAPAPAGTWIDQLDVDGRAAADRIPPSSFYHLFLAFAELLRLEPVIRAMP